MKKLSKLAFLNATVLTAPQMKDITGGHYEGTICELQCYHHEQGDPKEGWGWTSDGQVPDCSEDTIRSRCGGDPWLSVCHCH